MATYEKTERGAKPAAKADAGPRAANRTGLPDRLKAGVEALSGYSLDTVRVHYNSPEPQRLDALAYARGSEIHLGPGQEKHLPHEAWHLVQQASGRVRADMSLVNREKANADDRLEAEADRMGVSASRFIARAKPMDVDGARPDRVIDERISADANIHFSALNDRTHGRALTAGGVLQRKIRDDTQNYSFQNAFDINGNPYLIGDDEKHYRINVNQSGGMIKQEVQDIATKIPSNLSASSHPDVYQGLMHNIALGRSQVVEVEDRQGADAQRGILQPFKPYTTGAQTAPEIAAFDGNQDSTGAGLNWTNEWRALTGKLTKNCSVRPSQGVNFEQFIEAFKNECEGDVHRFEKKMSVVILAEEYRAPGSKQRFHQFIEELDQMINQSAQTLLSNDVLRNAGSDQLNKELYNQFYEHFLDKYSDINNEKLRQNLPFVGEGGKANAREQLRPEGATYTEATVPLLLRRPSLGSESAGSFQRTTVDDDDEKFNLSSHFSPPSLSNSSRSTSSSAPQGRGRNRTHNQDRQQRQSRSVSRAPRRDEDRKKAKKQNSRSRSPISNNNNRNSNRSRSRNGDESE